MQSEQTDVLIVGAGTGGVAAAIAAARAGATVLLLEQESMVGGTITGSYVSMPCGGPRSGLYEQMLERPGLGVAGMVAQSWVHLMVVVFIVFANVVFIIEKRKGV